jgi:hypothetical protein
MAQIYKQKLNGDPVPFEEAGMMAYTEQITAAQTLRNEDSGKVFVLNAAEGVAVTLPAVSDGLNYRIIVGLAFATSDWTVTSTTNVIEGAALVAGAVVPAVNENTISFVASAESVGDYVDLVSDGTSWYVSGNAVTAGAITFTVV